MELGLEVEVGPAAEELNVTPCTELDKAQQTADRTQLTTEAHPSIAASRDFVRSSPVQFSSKHVVVWLTNCLSSHKHFVSLLLHVELPAVKQGRAQAEMSESGMSDPIRTRRKTNTRSRSAWSLGLLPRRWQKQQREQRERWRNAWCSKNEKERLKNLRSDRGRRLMKSGIREGRVYKGDRICKGGRICRCEQVE